MVFPCLFIQERRVSDVTLRAVRGDEKKYPLRLIMKRFLILRKICRFEGSQRNSDTRPNFNTNV